MIPFLLVPVVAGGISVEGLSPLSVVPGDVGTSRILVRNDMGDAEGKAEVKISYEGICGEGGPGSDAFSIWMSDGKKRYELPWSEGSFSSDVVVGGGDTGWDLGIVSDPRICPGRYSAVVSFFVFPPGTERSPEPVGAESPTGGGVPVGAVTLSEASPRTVAPSAGDVWAVSVPEEKNFFSLIASLIGTPDEGSGMSARSSSVVAEEERDSGSSEGGDVSALGRIGVAMKGKAPIAVSATAAASLAFVGLRRRYVKMKRDLLS